MNLSIDRGNSRTKLGLFQGEQLIETLVIEKWSVEEIFDLATNQSVKNIILSNVAEGLPEEEREKFRNSFCFIELDANTPIPIINLYQTPQTLGKDRLAAVLGAYQLYPEQHCLVIDAGTCITYDLLTADGKYLGGNIAPGMKMRLQAMHHFTARLPLISGGNSENWIGDSTENALINGAQLGTILEIQGFIELSEAKLGVVTVIFTGGDANFFVKKLKREIFVNQNLVLIGLNKILNYNAKRL